jgi:hypothetical protein
VDGVGAAYVVIGALRVAAGRERIVGIVFRFQGVAFGVLGGQLLLVLAPPA